MLSRQWGVLRGLRQRYIARSCLPSLLHLGIKNIRPGPTLPAFVSPNVLHVLVDNYGIAPITTPEEDIKTLLG